jgi:hypothetical protein
MASSTTPSLPGRPKAVTYRVEDLLAEMEGGRIRVPLFQRPLKWERSDAWELLDSILRGYPVGTLLLWKGGQNIGERRSTLGGRQVQDNGVIADESGTDILWVVDGQQRLDALSRLLLGKNDSFQAWLDLDSPDAAPSRPLKDDIAGDAARWIPVRELRNSEAQLEWAFGVGLSAERRARAFQLGRRLREYEVPAYVIEADDEDVLRQVFKRINATGKQMKESEVFDALHGNMDGGGHFSLEDLSERLRELQFGDVPPQLLLQLAAVIANHDIGGLNKLRIEPPELAQTFERIRIAAGSAVQFLKEEAQIPHIRLLPYSHLFVVVARFFDRFADAGHLVRRQLAMAIWRGLTTDNASPRIRTIRTLIKLLNQSDATAAQVAGLLVDELGGGGRRELRPMDAFKLRAARAKIRALALWSLSPLDARTGLPVSAASVLDDDGTLASLLSSMSEVGTRDLSGNRVFHPSRSHITREFIAAPQRVRASHLLPAGPMPEPGDEAAWSVLIRAREDQLVALERDFANRLAAWSERPRPPISELWVDMGEEP